MALSTEATYLALGGAVRDNYVQIFGINPTIETMGEWNDYQRTLELDDDIDIEHVRFLPGDRYLLVASRSNTLEIWFHREGVREARFYIGPPR